MTEITTKVTMNNVKELFDNPSGNLYFVVSGQEYVVDGYSLKEIKHAMRNGVEFIFKK